MEPIQQKQATVTTSLNNTLANPLANQIDRDKLVVSKPTSIQPILNPKMSKEGIGTKMDYLIEKLTKEEMEKDTKERKKDWKFPFKWKRTMNKSLKNSASEMVLCFFINKKGELDQPVLLPIYNGNTLIHKYTIHEIDPRDIITLHQKKRSYKLLIYNITSRQAVSNRSYGEIRKGGESTIDDEVFIKAMLTAKASQITKQKIGKGALIIGGLVIAGIIIWFFSRS